MPEAKPFLKWAGGKRQLLSKLSELAPKGYSTYIEPFIGGGALFFHLLPEKSILSDLNYDLINCYVIVRDNVENLIKELKKFYNEEDFYYEVRSWSANDLSATARAARMIFLNKTGWHGLYRVNKKGEFNVPFGRRKNPLICDEDTLRAASKALQNALILHDDYKAILKKYAKAEDFVYLDPPYYPAGGYSDFKRYTKEFFYEEDHLELRDEFIRLIDKGCYALLTNSNTEFTRELYKDFNYVAVDTKRRISSNPDSRSGEDIIVFETKPQKKSLSQFKARKSGFLEDFPGTRFMGSKYRILPFLWEKIKALDFNSVLDAFSGSGCVSYMLKQKGKQVFANDFLHFSHAITKATVENSEVTLQPKDVELLMQDNPASSSFIYDTFKGLYFSDDANHFLDNFRANVEMLDNQYKKALAFASISRACLKRRPRGIFTYTGNRYDDGRRDLTITLKEHFIENVDSFNKAVFDNGQSNFAFNSDIFDLDIEVDLVYLDPPYYTPKSDNDYTRRYHFVEGLVRNWEGVEMMWKTKTKKFKRYETPFLHKDTIEKAFCVMFEKFKNSIIVLSYSSNSLPKKSVLVDMLKEYKKNVWVHQINHLYSFGTHGKKSEKNSNRVQEYIFIAY